MWGLPSSGAKCSARLNFYLTESYWSVQSGHLELANTQVQEGIEDLQQQQQHQQHLDSSLEKVLGEGKIGDLDSALAKPVPASLSGNDMTAWHII